MHKHFDKKIIIIFKKLNTNIFWLSIYLLYHVSGQFDLHMFENIRDIDCEKPGRVEIVQNKYISSRVFLSYLHFQW